MRQRSQQFRGACLGALALITISVGGGALAEPDFGGGFRSFCVGQCDPPPYTVMTAVEQPASSPLGFSFSIMLGDLNLPDDTGVAFLEILDDQREMLLRVKVMRLSEGPQGGFVLSLEYRIAGSLFGSMSLGESVGGEDCFWVERTLADLWGAPPSPAIRVTRTGTGAAYELGSVPLLGFPSVIRQGALETLGEPSGMVHITDASIGQACAP